ncbi:hypothetical protein NLI96_g1198 [Meripilus lineatus]|uniref:Uncharacterized protein n=1 Tax=Meripilus lineatus TaxID=2056292 RepID=A0AAD5VCI0_9APHY|nr:hypothetical protein NLI96_g1198 [Physisporinus lineatus]
MARSLNELTNTTVKFPAWTGDNGTPEEDSTGSVNVALSNGFGQALKGSPVNQHLPWRQATGIDVLNAAIDITTKSDPTPTTDPASFFTLHQSQATSSPNLPDASTSGLKPINIGLIVELSVSRIVLVCVIVAILYLWLRRRRRDPKPGAIHHGRGAEPTYVDIPLPSYLLIQGDIQPYPLSNTLLPRPSEKSRAFTSLNIRDQTAKFVWIAVLPHPARQSVPSYGPNTSTTRTTSVAPE